MNPMLMQMLMGQSGQTTPMQAMMNANGQQGMNPAMLQMLMNQQNTQSSGGMNPMLMQMLMGQNGSTQGNPIQGNPLQATGMQGMNPMLQMLMNQQMASSGSPLMNQQMPGGGNPMMNQQMSGGGNPMNSPGEGMNPALLQRLQAMLNQNAQMPAYSAPPIGNGGNFVNNGLDANALAQLLMQNNTNGGANSAYFPQTGQPVNPYAGLDPNLLAALAQSLQAQQAAGNPLAQAMGGQPNNPLAHAMGGQSGNPLAQAMGGQAVPGQGQSTFSSEQLAQLQEMMARVQGQTAQDWAKTAQETVREQRKNGTLDPVRVQQEMQSLLPLLDESGQAKLKKILSELLTQG